MEKRKKKKKEKVVYFLIDLQTKKTLKYGRKKRDVSDLKQVFSGCRLLFLKINAFVRRLLVNGRDCICIYASVPFARYFEDVSSRYGRYLGLSGGRVDSNSNMDFDVAEIDMFLGELWKRNIKVLKFFTFIY